MSTNKKSNIDLELEFAPFGQTINYLNNKNNKFYQNKCDAILISIDFKGFPMKVNFVKNATEYIEDITNIINDKFKIPCIVQNIVQSEVVILPYPNDKTRLVKSSNRIVDSLNLGRFTILSNVSQFSEFENYTYFGKISDGLSWLFHNKDEAIQKTKLGQEYVLENFSLKAICNKWLDIIKY